MNDIEVFQNIKQESKNKLKEILKVKKYLKSKLFFMKGNKQIKFIL